MECDICGREGALHCVTCARTFLEQPRYELAYNLGVGDTYARHAKAVVEGLEDQESQ
jgi:hypothetical protein